MKKSYLVAGVILLIIVIIFAIRGGSGAQNDDEVGGAVAEVDSSRAPSFELKNYAGETISSNDFGDRMLVLNAWASWCPFCVHELPDFIKLQQAYPEQIAVIAINRAEPVGTAKGYTDSINVSDDLVFLLDPNDSFYKSIGGFSMPETLFVGADGEVLRHKRGPFDFEEMKNIVDELLASN